MIMRNGRTQLGWRLDEVKADMATGMAMLMNPFAIVPDEKNADRIVAAFEGCELLLEALKGLLKNAAYPNPETSEERRLAFIRAAEEATAAVEKAEGNAKG